MDCNVAAADPALKEVSSGVDCRICWLWEKSGGVFIPMTWEPGGVGARL